MTMIARVTCKRCGEECDLGGCPCGYPAIEDASREATIRRVRTALKARSGKTWSVRGGRGTAYGWIKIDVPKDRLACTRDHQWDEGGMHCRFCRAHYLEVDRMRFAPRETARTCPEHACDDRCFRAYISPEEQEELARLLGLDSPAHPQGVNIPADTSYRVEFIDRAEGRKPRRYGVQYWD